MRLPTLHAPHGHPNAPIHPKLPHKWEPDFSEGEPATDSKLCGICGRTDDKYHREPDSA